MRGEALPQASVMLASMILPSMMLGSPSSGSTHPSRMPDASGGKRTACCAALGGHLRGMRAHNLLLDVVGHHVVLLELHGVLRAALGHAPERAHILEHL